jgi:glycosyltransferase involved in cell wall biosynthesis
MHDIRSISHAYLAALDAERNPFEQRLRRMFSLSLVKPLLGGVLSPTRIIAVTIREYIGIEPCVVYIGVDHAIYRPAQIREVRGFKAVLVVVTKLHITKTAIAVFKKLKTRAKLFVRGPCPAGLKDVVCIPKLPEEALPRLYASADVLFYPSLHEGFGLVSLEAAAYGLPVIAFNEPAVAEVLGGAGLFVKPTSIAEVAEVVDWALNNEKLLKELSVRGLRRAREFSWERTAKMLYTCIEKFVRL